MKLKCLIVICCFLSHAATIAQGEADQVLFTVDDEPVYASEFKRVYKKNLNLVQDESQKDIDAYLKLFVNYKVKLKEARAQGLHEKPTYKRELSNYKKQLAKNYMSDNTISEAIVAEAYEHFSNEVNANHILVRISENAIPEDTLEAYNKLIKIRERTLEEGFETVRKQVHDGRNIYGEELGWFTAFRMVYPFEKAAFQTTIGETSKPFRTQFGYHIVHVKDKRKSRGERKVKHIMVIDKKEDSTGNTSETRIKELYKKIQQGEEFEALAKEFSDDKNSAPKGGELRPFSSGQLSAPAFEEAAFALENPGDISQPVKTKFGWHIIKLKDSKPIGTFNQLRSEIEAKVKRDSRSKLIDEALVAKLKAKHMTGEAPNLNDFANILDDSYFKRQWKLPQDFNTQKPLAKLGKKTITYGDFGAYLSKYQRAIRGKKSYGVLVKEAYQAFVGEQLKQYEEDNLEYENEDFAYILAEYRDGLLLFDLMENNIWKTAKTDSLEIQNYFESHKENYFWPRRAVADVASSTKKKVANRVAKLLKEGMSAEHIKKLVNTNGDIHVIFTSDTMAADHQALPKLFEFKPGISKIYKHNQGYVVANVKDILPKEFKPFKDVKGLVMSDYQSYKEALWIEELKKKYKVVVNDQALEHVKAEL